MEKGRENVCNCPSKGRYLGPKVCTTAEPRNKRHSEEVQLCRPASQGNSTVGVSAMRNQHGVVPNLLLVKHMPLALIKITVKLVLSRSADHSMGGTKTLRPKLPFRTFSVSNSMALSQGLLTHTAI